MTLSTPAMANEKTYSKTDLLWLNRIARIKWQDGYKCQKCGNEKFFEGKTPYSRKCTLSKCKHEESATANTPFHGLRISITQAAEILDYLIEVYREYHAYINSNEYLRDEKQKNIRIRIRETTVRASSERIAMALKMHQRTVYLFLVRFMQDLPDDYLGSYVSDQWFRGVDEKNRQKYTNLYHLIERGVSAHGMIEYAITKVVRK